MTRRTKNACHGIPHNNYCHRKNFHRRFRLFMLQ